MREGVVHLCWLDQEAVMFAYGDFVPLPILVMETGYKELWVGLG